MHVESIELNLPEVYFNEDGSLKEHGGMDIVVGNPPWDIWKANSDDFFSEYDNDFRGLPNKRVKTERMKELFTNLSGLKDKWDAEQQRFKDGSKYFTYKYQRWTVNGRKTSSDLNLYKISVERFAQLVSSSARFSILVPDNFATDNGPTGIRHLVLDNYHLEEFVSFENRKSIFPAIDNRYKFVVLTFNYGDAEIDSFKAFFYRHSLDDLSNEEVKLNYPVDFIKQTEPERYAFVEARTPELFDLFKKIRTRFPDLNHTRLLKFSRDFDANKESSKFIYKNDGESLISIYEGKTFNQFTIEPQKIKHYVTAEKMEKIISTVAKEQKLGHKVIVISEFADTVNYYYENLYRYFNTPEITLPMGKVLGNDKENYINRIPAKNKEEVLDAFSPVSKRQQQIIDDDRQIDLVVGTDTISTGQNLQDAVTLINLDLPYNPMIL